MSWCFQGACWIHKIAFRRWGKRAVCPNLGIQKISSKNETYKGYEKEYENEYEKESSGVLFILFYLSNNNND
jgi:hypothetical protein